METSVGGYCAVLLPMSSPLSSCSPSLFCYLQHPWNFSFLHTGPAWTFSSMSGGFYPPGSHTACGRTGADSTTVWGVLGLGSVLQTRSLGGFGTRGFSEEPDPLNRRCHVTRFMLTAPLLHTVCQSLPFAGQLFFYQFPWRCACVHVRLRV